MLRARSHPGHGPLLYVSRVVTVAGVEVEQVPFAFVLPMPSYTTVGLLDAATGEPQRPFAEWEGEAALEKALAALVERVGA